jgi:hypothetical protein
MTPAKYVSHIQVSVHWTDEELLIHGFQLQGPHIERWWRLLFFLLGNQIY